MTWIPLLSRQRFFAVYFFVLWGMILEVQLIVATVRCIYIYYTIYLLYVYTISYRNNICIYIWNIYIYYLHYIILYVIYYIFIIIIINYYYYYYYNYYIYYVWGILYVWGLNTWSEEKFIESIDLRISKWTQVIIEFSSGKLSATTQGNVLNDEVAGKQRWEVGMVSWKVFSCGVVGHLGFHDTLLFTWELQVNGCELMLKLRDKVEIYVYI
jgi:hypothetical protein